MPASFAAPATMPSWTSGPWLTYAGTLRRRMAATFSWTSRATTGHATAMRMWSATLHILDGLIGVYEGGPGTWNTTWATWPYKALFFATDPVAMDHVGWNIIDAKRLQEGWQPVSRMGLLQDMPVAVLSRRLAALGGKNLSDAQALESAKRLIAGGRATEVFDRRQPEHIILASLIGLGKFNADEIDHRV